MKESTTQDGETSLFQNWIFEKERNCRISIKYGNKIRNLNAEFLPFIVILNGRVNHYALCDSKRSKDF